MALDYKIIGKRLKEARVSKKLTQEALAETIDISVAFLSRVERGTSPINLRRLSQICNLLDISEGYVLNGTTLESDIYLKKEFRELFEKCTPKQQRLIYNLAKTVLETGNDE